MSREHFKGSAYLFAKWMQQTAEEIAAGKMKGVKVIYRKPDRRKTHLDRFRLQLWKRRA